VRDTARAARRAREPRERRYCALLPAHPHLTLTPSLFPLPTQHRSEFGVGLNKPLASGPGGVGGALPGDGFPLLTGDTAPSYGDLLVVALHKLVVDGSPALGTLYSCFLTVLANVSPYARGLTLASAVRLCNLLELFASPSFLLAKPGNFSHAAALTEALTNLVQYQSESNAPLIYAIARRGPLFHRLASMSIGDGGAAGATASAAVESASASNPLRAVLPYRGRGAGAAPVGTAAPAAPASPASHAPPARAASPAAPVAPAAAGGVGLDAASPEDVDASEWVTRNARAGSAGADEGSDSKAAAPLEDSAPVVAAAPAADAPPEAALSQAAAPSTPPPPPAQHRWAPTDEWLETTVKPALRLGTLLRLVAYVTSLLERASADAGGAPLDDAACLEIIRSTTLVGVLPQPHPLVQRVYAPNDWTGLWLSTFTWSTVYLAHARGLPLFDAGAIRLFQITVTG
jgi:hypothetical protein